MFAILEAVYYYLIVVLMFISLICNAHHSVLVLLNSIIAPKWLFLLREEMTIYSNTDLWARITCSVDLIFKYC